VKIIKVMGVLGLGTDFLFHWIETRTVIGFLIDGFYDVQLELGGAWGWGASFLALGAHALFVFGFLALIALPLKIEEMKYPWDGLKQVVQIFTPGPRQPDCLFRYGVLLHQRDQATKPAQGHPQQVRWSPHPFG